MHLVSKGVKFGRTRKTEILKMSQDMVDKFLQIKSSMYSFDYISVHKN